MTTLIYSVFFGSIGFGFFIYGKKQQKLAPLICGAGLSVLPYFMSSPWGLGGAGVVLIALPWFLRG